MSEILDDLKRLERAGAEGSRATKKLIEAVKRVSRAIGVSVPMSLRGYDESERPVCLFGPGPVGGRSYLVLGYGDDAARLVLDDEAESREIDDRGTALDFAADVAAGLIAIVAARVEAEVERDRAAIAKILEPAQGADPRLKDADACPLCPDTHGPDEGTPGYSCDRPTNEGGNR